MKFPNVFRYAALMAICGETTQVFMWHGDRHEPDRRVARFMPQTVWWRAGVLRRRAMCCWGNPAAFAWPDTRRIHRPAQHEARWFCFRPMNGHALALGLPERFSARDPDETTRGAARRRRPDLAGLCTGNRNDFTPGQG